MKPIIGIITSTELDERTFYTAKDNTSAISNAGGIPVLLPYYQHRDDLYQMATLLDGLYATGGYDIDPTLFGEEPHPNLGSVIPARDAFEIQLIRIMMDMDKPILGVCRGCQTLNIAAGGDMYQDIYSQLAGELLQHQQNAPKEHGSHYVDVRKNSLLYRITGETKLRVNSRHHQANRNVVNPLQISGKASDGVIEAIESKEHNFILGLQWHPESMIESGDIASKAIFKAFLESCRK
ncbi:gamma-glutamyl-gamma-aminobutyrate hydrolase family protein [Ornithinibacillus bavariensis]|uniref:Gamma-glutamyl-gamma-aminobutyrate hydrolase n=1 Tax=Ornithinibacillus bavariensis TaxID=545502 RepID=A0A919XAF4_9BACI|nr:gamma-glutamyl-gamma-aminobutyrate hydrolase family protein [Ornithinibacillus bavariensis]GIO27080.1 gamma-glutamyl-gamma-aminobutyrate hydrolase [Ornithinibacillus bavariensis]